VMRRPRAPLPDDCLSRPAVAARTSAIATSRSRRSARFGTRRVMVFVPARWSARARSALLDCY
jgi:hypothetical protein